MTTPRYNIYTFIHKGLRAYMAHALVRVGRFDPHETFERRDVLDEVRTLLDFCEHHVHNENRVIHAAMEARRPGSSQGTAGDHEEHFTEIARLRRFVEHVETQEGTARENAAALLYRELAAFAADNYAHMAVEESHNIGVLWECYSDAEIHALEHDIVSHQSMDEAAVALRWMLPHMNPEERVRMLGGVRQTVPGEVFEQILGLIRPLLQRREWQKLSQALGLPQPEFAL